MRKLGHAVLSYSLKRLREQQETQNRRRDKSSRPKPSRSRSRTSLGSAGKEGGRSRDLARHDSDMHNVMSQVAVGIVAFGIRHLIKRRHEAKRQAQAEAAAAPTRAAGMSLGLEQRQRRGAADPELCAALNTVTAELHGASESVRRLAHSAPSHLDCPVREALVADADKLQGSLGSLQVSINNMQNLHPGLDQGRQNLAPERSRRQERTRRSGGGNGRERTGDRGTNEVELRPEERAAEGSTRTRGTRVDKEPSRRDGDQPRGRPRSRLPRWDRNDEFQRGHRCAAGRVPP